jgi:hypothetical protein
MKLLQDSPSKSVQDTLEIIEAEALALLARREILARPAIGGILMLD